MKILLLLALIPLVKCFTCPDIKDIENFDASKLLGEWYIVKYTPNRFDEGYECSIDSVVSYENKEIYGVYRRLDVSSNTTDTSNYTIIPVDGHTTKFSAKFTTKNETVTAENIYIIDTDYDNYLLYVICREDGKYAAKAGWLEAKNKRSLSEEHIQKAMKKFQEYDFEPEEFLTSDETNCKE